MGTRSLCYIGTGWRRCLLGIVFLALPACELSIRPAGSQRTEFSQKWPFDAGTSSAYTFNSTKIALAGGVCSLKGTDQVDDDISPQGFGAANFVGVDWSGAGYSTVTQSSPMNIAELDSSWAPKWANVVTYYKFNNSWNDQVGTNHLTPQNGATFSMTNVKIGSNAASFDGVNDYSSIASNPFGFTTQNFSYALWVKFNSLSPGGAVETTLFDAGNYVAYVRNDGLIRFTVYAPGPTLYVNFGSAMQAGVWTHIAIVRNGTAVKIYMNGVDVTTTSVAIPSSITAAGGVPFYVGYSPGYPTEFISAYLDDFVVWNTNLTATDVQALYARQAARYSGVVTSRVMDALSAGRAWTTLSWKSTLPTLKELPDAASAAQGEKSIDYSALVGSSDAIGDDDLMSGIVGIWHLNEAAGTSAANSVLDHSGNGKHGTPMNTVTFGRPGQFQTSASFSSSYIKLPAIMPAGAYTKSAWILTGTTGLKNIFSCDDNTLCNAAFFINAGNLYLGHNGTNYAGSSIPVPLNTWVHVAATFDPSVASGTVKTYINGQVVGSATGAVTHTNAGNLDIGAWALNLGSFYYDGSIDEVALWSRALQPAEIFQLYRRGANRVKFQVRICAAANCSDDPSGSAWKGPDGTNQTYFTELNNNSAPLAGTGSVLRSLPSMLFSAFTSPVGTSQYFQYRMILETDDTSTACNYGSGPTWCSPELQSVRVDPTHYDSSVPSIVGKAGANFSSLKTFVETQGSSCAGGIGYNLGIGADSSTAIWFWWDPSARSGQGGWAVADGTSLKSSSAATLSAHVDSFAAQAGTSMAFFKAYLKSNGDTACELDQLELKGF